MGIKIVNTNQCLGDLAEKWARKNKIPYPKAKDRRTMADPEYLAMYNQWPGFYAMEMGDPPSERKHPNSRR